jgi:hypothetical protein
LDTSQAVPLLDVRPIDGVGVIVHPIIGSYLDYAVTIDPEGAKDGVVCGYGTGSSSIGLTLPDSGNLVGYSFAQMYGRRPRHSGIVTPGSPASKLHKAQVSLERTIGASIIYCKARAMGDSMGAGASMDDAGNVWMPGMWSADLLDVTGSYVHSSLNIDVSIGYEITSDESTIDTPIWMFEKDIPKSLSTITEIGATIKPTYTVNEMTYSYNMRSKNYCKCVCPEDNQDCTGTYFKYVESDGDSAVSVEVTSISDGQQQSVNIPILVSVYPIEAPKASEYRSILYSTKMQAFLDSTKYDYEGVPVVFTRSYYPIVAKKKEIQKLQVKKTYYYHYM